jgi:uncharacterized membrane protein YkvA (DUF1232 family)
MQGQLRGLYVPCPPLSSAFRPRVRGPFHMDFRWRPRYLGYGDEVILSIYDHTPPVSGSVLATAELSAADRTPFTTTRTSSRIAPGRLFCRWYGKSNTTQDVMTLFASVKTWAHTIKRDVVALWIAAHDRRVPWFAKLVASAVAAYGLSPIDLIPDFIPVLGYLDDLIIVPLGILLAIRLVPDNLMQEFREEAARREGRPKSYLGLAAIVILWITCAAWLMWLFWPVTLNTP